MRVFLSGGCKNGKSTYAQSIAYRQKNKAPLYYIATMRPMDEEDRERICRHVREREELPFETVEISEDIADVKERCNRKGSFLLDSMTALLANEMFRGEDIFPGASDKIISQMDILFRELENLVLVSDYIYSDAWQYDANTRQYCEQLAALDRFCASRCDVVIEVCGGMIMVQKGDELYRENRKGIFDVPVTVYGNTNEKERLG